MSKSHSQKKYEELKAYYKEQAKKTEKQLHMDLTAVRHEYVPHHLKSKFLTGCAIFGSVYLTEKLIFGKRLPRIIRFTTSLAGIVLVPKVYQKIHDKITGVGELEPIEIEMIEDQQLAECHGEIYIEENVFESDEDELSAISEPHFQEEALENPEIDPDSEDDEDKPLPGSNPT